MRDDDIIGIAIKKAQQIARVGLKIGQVVAHPSDRFAYELRSIHGNTAIVGYNAEESPNGLPVEKKFPLNELFCPNVAEDEAKKLTVSKLTRGKPILN